MDHPWIFDRCREVQESPNGHLDLWARVHFKSSVITQGKSIQDILASHGDEPLEEWDGNEVTIAIFSHTRPIAKGFLRQIKREFETNEKLKDLFPDILWENPFKEAPKWSEDDGLVVKRKSNPKESTLEAWGVVDAQPTSKHFLIRVYDDVVTSASVTTPEMMEKVLKECDISQFLGVADGGIARYIGTRYHANDYYKTLIKRGRVIPRIYTATKNGEIDGEPVLLTQKQLNDKRKDIGPYEFACQLMQDPVADQSQGFRREWLTFYDGKPDHSKMNIYILVDAANEKKKRSDYTAMVVFGLGPDGNLYLLDMIRDRLSLTERANALFCLVQDWSLPGRPVKVGYEKYGANADVEYMREEMNRHSYHFPIIPLGGPTGKRDRIRRLVPGFENGNVLLPRQLIRENYEGKQIDLIEAFIEEEYVMFPVSEHDDMLDAMARIKDEDFYTVTPNVRDDTKSFNIPQIKYLNPKR